MRLGVGTLLALVGLLAVQLPAAPRPPHSPRPGTGVLALDWGDLDRTPEAADGDYLVIQPWEYDRIPAYRAANPGIRILMYKDVSATVDKPHGTGLYPTGLSYSSADQHPEWFLTDAFGNRLEWADYPGLLPMDVGDTGYQDAWVDDVLTELQTHDWDGVMLDDTLTSLSHPTVGGLTSTQIPDDESMREATASFLSRVGPRLKDAGYLAIPNLTVDPAAWDSVVPDWSPYVSGWETEYFVKWGTDGEPRFEGDLWRSRLDMAAWCADHHVPLLAVTYGSAEDTETQKYHRATWLLAWDGTTGASVFVPEQPDAGLWQARANTDIGRPAGPRTRLANGVYLRPYSGGIVVVNPTSATRAVDLGGTYQRVRNQPITSVRLAPATAVMLRRVR